MTANTFASDRRKCREAGMNGYIPKPVSVKDIEDALTEIHSLTAHPLRSLPQGARFCVLQWKQWTVRCDCGGLVHNNERRLHGKDGGDGRHALFSAGDLVVVPVLEILQTQLG